MLIKALAWLFTPPPKTARRKSGLDQDKVVGWLMLILLTLAAV